MMIERELIRRDLIKLTGAVAATLPVMTLGESASAVAAVHEVYDTDRIMYLRNYLTQLQRATADGVPVNGYFQWSMMDNFEWNAGFGNRFGLVHVDFKTQNRKLKLSAEWFREAARQNTVV